MKKMNKYLEMFIKYLFLQSVFGGELQMNFQYGTLFFYC